MIQKKQSLLVGFLGLKFNQTVFKFFSLTIKKNTSKKKEVSIVFSKFLIS